MVVLMDVVSDQLWSKINVSIAPQQPPLLPSSDATGDTTVVL